MQFYEKALTKYNQSSLEQKSYLNLGLTLGLLILLLALIFPAVNHILKLNKELADGRKVENQLQEKVIALETAETNYNTVKERLSIVNDALPTGSDVDTHLRLIEQLVNKSGTTLSGAQFSDIPISLPVGTNNLAVKEVEYALTVSGTFANLTKFITDLEDAVRTVEIISLAMSEDGSTLSATMNVTTNYLGQSVGRSAQSGSTNQSIPTEGQ